MKIIENEEETQDVLEYMRSISNIPKYVPMKTTLVEWCVYWLQTRACNIKESTRSSYEHVIKNHIKRVFGTMKLEEVTSDDVQLFINIIVFDIITRDSTYPAALLASLRAFSISVHSDVALIILLI